MTEETKVIKRYKSFILGYCKCNCGNEIKIITSAYKKGIGHWLQTYKNGHNQPDYSKIKYRTRENHHRWNNGERKAGKYTLILRKHHLYSDFHGYVFRHRYRMELMLGRYLTEKEVIHHIDRDPTNDEESNLMLFASHSEHLTYERIKDMSGRICIKCGANKTYSRIRKGKLRVEWYGDEKDGWVCAKCYRRIQYNIKSS